MVSLAIEAERESGDASLVPPGADRIQPTSRRQTSPLSRHPFVPAAPEAQHFVTNALEGLQLLPVKGNVNVCCICGAGSVCMVKM